MSQGLLVELAAGEPDREERDLFLLRLRNRGLQVELAGGVAAVGQQDHVPLTGIVEHPGRRDRCIVESGLARCRQFAQSVQRERMVGADAGEHLGTIGERHDSDPDVLR